MRNIVKGNRLLQGYLLIAYVFVQAISVYLHVDVHALSGEPEFAHHHYPVMSFFADAHDTASKPGKLQEINLKLDGSLASKLSAPMIAILFAIMLYAAAATRMPRWSRTPNIHYSPITLYQSPPLRAPPSPAI